MKLIVLIYLHINNEIPTKLILVNLQNKHYYLIFQIEHSKTCKDQLLFVDNRFIYANPSELLRKLYHTMEKSLLCGLCSKTFTLKSNLTECIHTGQT